MNQVQTRPDNVTVYYRLIALWVINEAMLGGIIHGLRIPVSGLIVGSCAVICISLIAWYVPRRATILKATLIVAIFKMMLSPQAPPPAYIAVFFQGLTGELIFWNKRRGYAFACLLFASLALAESGSQRIIVMTITYGNDFWRAVNTFINGLTKQKVATNYSLIIAGGYVIIHIIAGIIVGIWTSILPKRISNWQQAIGNKQYANSKSEIANLQSKIGNRKRRKLKTGLLIIWIALIALYIQSYFKIGTPILPGHISLKIFIRSIIVVLTWYFVVGPLSRKLLHYWLQKKQSSMKLEIQQVLDLLPTTQALIAASWKESKPNKNWRRITTFSKIVLTKTLTPPLHEESGWGGEGRADGKGSRIIIYTAPIQSGKTTSLLNWSSNRNDVFGILTPIINGKRVFMDVHTKVTWPMEAEHEEDSIDVGRFRFSKKGFERAIETIRASTISVSSIRDTPWLVIDEIGPLELRDEGFANVFKEALNNHMGRLLVVVRDKDDMINRVKIHFNIPQATIISNLAPISM